MTADGRALRTVLADGDLVLEPMVDAHREPLRAVCAADPAIWQIYSVSFYGDAFDHTFDGLLIDRTRTMLAVARGGTVIGMSSYLNLAPEHRRLEIGNTYLDPRTRGDGTNTRLKRLMIDHAFACGFERIEFRIDARNARSRAAVRKIGGVQEGVMRRHMVTWTGHVRDTVAFSILRDEWRG